MSIRDFAKHDFYAVKQLPKQFKFYVISHQEKETQYGIGQFLLGQIVQTEGLSKKTPSEGLLRISPTTAGTFPKGYSEWDQLKGKVIAFEWDDDLNTIRATAIEKWTGERAD